jgi:hypothetical protein
MGFGVVRSSQIGFDVKRNHTPKLAEGLVLSDCFKYFSGNRF